MPSSAADTVQDKILPRPFLKWAGGKGQLIPQLLKRVPEHYGRYFEPFVGGGALFFELRPARACLSDVNDELINVFQIVQSDVEALIEDLMTHQHSEQYFYSIRDLDRDPAYNDLPPLKRASRLMYLNRTCFNGLYRVNSKGQFNVPYGDYKNPRIVDAENLRACSASLGKTDLRVESFESVLDRVEKGDFVYLDPPYVPLNPTSSFTGYSKGGFSAELQQRLRDVCADLARKNVTFMLSNSCTELVLELYRDFKVEIVHAARAINSKATHRGKVAEVIVSNF